MELPFLAKNPQKDLVVQINILGFLKAKILFLKKKKKGIWIKCKQKKVLVHYLYNIIMYGI